MKNLMTLILVILVAGCNQKIAKTESRKKISVSKYSETRVQGVIYYQTGAMRLISRKTIIDYSITEKNYHENSS